MVSASFAMEQSPACSATQTTGECVLPTGSTKMWVDLADVLCYVAHLPLNRGLDVSVFMLIIILNDVVSMTYSRLRCSGV